MELEPIIVQIKKPEGGGPFKHLPKLPHFGPKGTKILIAVSAIVISLTLVGFVAISILVSSNDFRAKHGLNVNPQDKSPVQTSGTVTSDKAAPGGGVATGVGGFTGTNSPVITLTADPAKVIVGGTTTLTWSVTKNPTSCVASDDWSGTKQSSGTEKSIAMTKSQTYLFTITCKNATGTGFSTVSVGASAPTGTGNIATRPTVTLAANPSAVYNGDQSTLTWSTTNNPTSCVASGDWSGPKAATGPASTGALTTNKSYTYTLTCTNSAGTGSDSTSVLVRDPPPDTPIVTISSNPVSPVTPGQAVTLTWSTTNNPTSCVASGDWSGSKAGSGSMVVGPLNTIKTYNFDITCSNGTGGTFDSVAIAVIPPPPSVSLTGSPSSIYTGSSSTLSWTVTNNPSSCTASGDWAGSKSASGSQSTGTLTTLKTYYYTLTCTNAGGTGFASNVPVTVTNPPAPIVSLNASPISVNSGGSSTISWSSTNNPSSCTASGDWAGSKSASGSQSTGTLSTVKTYSYTLKCTNAGGSDTASTSVSVSSGNPATKPVVSISASPTSVGTGSTSTIAWSATNSPTSCTASGSWSGAKGTSGSQSTGTMNSAGNYTYTLTCANAAGSTAASAVLTVIAIPVVSVSLSPASITTGGAATIAWSATNSPSSCTAGGSWSGSKGSSGSQSTGTMNSAGSYTYTLSCTNSGGTASSSASLTVQPPATVYCSGNTPCYGPNDLAGHASPGSCWAWNANWVINITSFRPSHPGGIKSGSTSTIENAAAVCNHDLASVLAGSASIPGYKDSSGSTTHNHNSSTKSNSGGSQLLSYRVGYYDATKP